MFIFQLNDIFNFGEAQLSIPKSYWIQEERIKEVPNSLTEINVFLKSVFLK